MELQFLDRAGNGTNAYKSRKNKFVGVRQRPSGKWVAEIKNTTQKIRMWLGTFDTAEEAAQAYDEAACLLHGKNTRTNFLNNMPCNPALSMKIRNLLNQKRSLNKTKSPHLATPRKSSNLESSIPKAISSTNTISSSSSQNSTNVSFSSSQNSTSVSFSSYQHTSSLGVSNPVIFEDAYKPPLSTFIGGNSPCFPNYSNNYDQSSAFFMDFEQINAFQQNVFEAQKGAGETLNDEQFPDFERMNVERQISASLYAMNGINEYWENIHDSNDPSWDLSMLCQMYCSS